MRKKYTPEEAKNRITNDLIMIDTCQEIINTFMIKEDPLIQALVWKTRAEIIEENQKTIDTLFKRILYCENFINN